MCLGYVAGIYPNTGQNVLGASRKAIFYIDNNGNLLLSNTDSVQELQFFPI
jgi:hypothetical protein